MIPSRGHVQKRRRQTSGCLGPLWARGLRNRCSCGYENVLKLIYSNGGTTLECTTGHRTVHLQYVNINKIVKNHHDYEEMTETSSYSSRQVTRKKQRRKSPLSQRLRKASEHNSGRSVPMKLGEKPAAARQSVGGIHARGTGTGGQRITQAQGHAQQWLRAHEARLHAGQGARMEGVGSGLPALGAHGREPQTHGQEGALPRVRVQAQHLQLLSCSPVREQADLAKRDTGQPGLLLTPQSPRPRPACPRREGAPRPRCHLLGQQVSSPERP